MGQECKECGFDNPSGWPTCARCGTAFGDPPADEDEVTTANRRARAAVSTYPPPASTAPPRPLFGQDHIVAQLGRIIDRAFTQGTPTLIAIEGEAGAGKTRLLHAASEVAAKLRDDVAVRYGARRPTDDGPYAPFGRLLRERFEVTPSSSPTRVRAHIGEVVAQALHSDDMSRLAETAHLVGHVAGVPFPDSPFLRGVERNPVAFALRVASAVARFLEGEASRQPLLVLLDNMAEADDEAWELLDAVLATKAPIAIVVTGAPPLSDRIESLFASDAVASLRIAPLSTEDMAAIVHAVVPNLVEIPSPLLDALAHRTQGNPGTLRELLRALADGGLFQPTARGMETDMSRLEGDSLPLTMRDATRARLARLEPTALRLLQYAAVVGEVFWDGVLLALERANQLPPEGPALELWTRDDDEIALDQALESLVQRRFLTRVARSPVPGRNELAFQFAGTREVLYDDLPEEHRARAHGVVARWLAAARNLGTDGQAAVMASHLERAGQPERAATAYLQAAAEARDRMRTTMALRYVDRALASIPSADVVGVIDALHERGSLLTVLGRYDEAHEAFSRIARLAWTLGARGRGGAALNRIARIHRQRGEHALALEYLKRALVLFHAANDQPGIASSYDDMAQVHRLLGHPDNALSAAHAALEIRAQGKDDRGQGVSHNTIGYIELDRGRFDDAESHFVQALQVRESTGDHEGAAQTRLALARVALQRGKIEESIALAENTLEAAREMDNHRLQSYLLDHLGQAWLAASDVERAHAALLEARELATHMRDHRLMADIERNLGLVALYAGDENAGEILQSALQLAHDYGAVEMIALAQRAQARLQARTLFDTAEDTKSSAEATYRECVHMFDACGARHESARTLAELGRHLIERSEPDKARAALRNAARIMEELALPELSDVEDTLTQL